MILTSYQCLLYGSEDNPESAERIKMVIQELRRSKFKIKSTKRLASEEEILQAHSKSYLDKLKNGTFENLSCPAYPRIFYFASLSAGIAIESISVAESENVFSLIRPPGHHAEKDKAMGFCYLNNAAIAAHYALSHGFQRVAILDLDNHYGNGTQQIVSGLERIIHVDLHKFPDYPESPRIKSNNCINFSLPGNISERNYLKTLEIALAEIHNFVPSILIVSMGFDTFREDPIGNLGLEIVSYFTIGQMIKELKVPVSSLLEGGYNTSSLPFCVLAYLNGIDSFI